MLKGRILSCLLATLSIVCAVAESNRLWSFPLETSNDHRRLQSTGQHANPYAGFGMHFVPIYFGNPAQLRTLAVSTSEAYTAMPCEDCTQCGERGANLYNHTLSARASVKTCNSDAACDPGFSCFKERCMYGRSIRDGSTFTGYAVSDVAYDGGGRIDSITGTDEALTSGFPLKFICQTTTRGYFNSVMDGVLGLGPTDTSFLSQMHKAGKLEHPRFSLCFDGAGSDGAGVVTLGGFRQRFVNTEMVYAKKIDGMTYRVNIKKIHLRIGGGSSVRAESDVYEKVVINLDEVTGADTTAVLDSAEPFLRFDERLEEPFREAWHRVTGHAFSHVRTSLTTEQMSQLPTLLIELEGDPDSSRDLDPSSVPSLTENYNVLVAVPASHYIERLNTGRRPHRARIHFEGTRGSFLGASLMKGHTVAYEPDRNRIGFAESRSCSTDGWKGGRNGAGGAVGGGIGGNGEADDTSGGTSIATSSGAAPVSSAGTTGNPGSSALVGGTDDDLFIAGSESQESSPEEEFDGGGCFSASCRSFMAIGYVFVGTTLAVVYRVSRPKERIGMKAYRQYTMEEAVPQNDDDLSPAYRRRAWNDGGEGGVMV